MGLNKNRNRTCHRIGGRCKSKSFAIKMSLHASSYDTDRPSGCGGVFSHRTFVGTVSLLCLILVSWMNWLAVDHAAHARFHHALELSIHDEAETSGCGHKDGRTAGSQSHDSETEDTCVITLLASGQWQPIVLPDTWQTLVTKETTVQRTAFLPPFGSGCELLPFSCGPPV